MTADTGATFSKDGVYRFLLWRRWSSVAPVCFIMLNPSTADATKDDPTVFRCGQRAHAMRAGGLEVVNLFALRSTDPRALYRHPDPVGAGNNDYILDAARRASCVICAWGTHGSLRERGKVIIGLLRAHGVVPRALRVNADGSPAHPLYLPYSAAPLPFGGPI